MDVSNTRIAIIGLGYVGLPLAVEFGKKFRTTGFDINTARVAELQAGQDRTLEVSPDMQRRQVTVIGSWTFSTVGQAECARFVADRRVNVDALFTHSWRLEQAQEAYTLFDRQTTGKGVFLPN